MFCATGLPGTYMWHCGGLPVHWECGTAVQIPGVAFDTKTAPRCATFAALRKDMLGAWAQLKRHTGVAALSVACVPSTASHGCEVWGLRNVRDVSKRGRDALITLHL